MTNTHFIIIYISSLLSSSSSSSSLLSSSSQSPTHWLGRRQTNILAVRDNFEAEADIYTIIIIAVIVIDITVIIVVTILQFILTSDFCRLASQGNS